MNKLFVMKGLPSSGKSTRAKELAGDSGVVFSTDEFFYEVEQPEKPNIYSFNPNRLGEAHRWNQKRAKEAMDSNVPVVVIDNTSVKKYEPEVYIKHAFECDYEVSIEEPTSPHWLEMRDTLRSKDAAGIKKWSEFLAEMSKKTHNVPQHAIERMMKNWEEFTVEDFR